MKRRKFTFWRVAEYAIAAVFVAWILFTLAMLTGCNILENEARMREAAEREAQLDRIRESHERQLFEKDSIVAYRLRQRDSAIAFLDSFAGYWYLRWTACSSDSQRAHRGGFSIGGVHAAGVNCSQGHPVPDGYTLVAKYIHRDDLNDYTRGCWHYLYVKSDLLLEVYPW